MPNQPAAEQAHFTDPRVRALALAAHERSDDARPWQELPWEAQHAVRLTAQGWLSAAVAAGLLPPADRAAILTEAADCARRLDEQHHDERAQGAWDVENTLRAELRRLAAEAPTTTRPSSGPPCGNNPNFRLSHGDQQAVDEFKAYLAQRTDEKRRNGAQPCSAALLPFGRNPAERCVVEGKHVEHVTAEGRRWTVEESAS